MAKPLLIFGTGKFAELAYYYFVKVGGRNVAAFTVDKQYIQTEHFQHLPVVAFENIEQEFPPNTHDMFIAIGSSQMNGIRIQKYLDARKKGYKLASFISPNAVVHTEQIGDNCFIMDYNNIHPYTRIGNNVICSNSNHIGHHSVIEDHCFISSNVVIGGGTRIGEASFLGINATIRDHITIGKRNIIGAGALILHDTQDEQVFSVPTTPARLITSQRVKDV